MFTEGLLMHLNMGIDNLPLLFCAFIRCHGEIRRGEHVTDYDED